jgi:hypothetical protein
MAEDDTRTLADERRRLFARMELERNQLLRNIETCRIRDIDRPFIGEWSLKDIVGHVISWDAEHVTILREYAAGKHPALSELDDSTRDRWNEDHVERTRGLNFWSLLEQLDRGRERLLGALGICSDEELTNGSEPNRIALAALEHDREHWHEIAARLAGMAGVRSQEPATTA